MGWSVSAFCLIPCDQQVLTGDFSDPVPILTPSGVIIALLSGRPAGLDWDVRMQNLESAMDDTRRKIGLDKGGTPHRRGGYHCLNTGLSLGGGSKVRTFATLCSGSA